MCLVHSASGLYTPPTVYGALSYHQPLVERVMLTAGCAISLYSVHRSCDRLAGVLRNRMTSRTRINICPSMF